MHRIKSLVFLLLVVIFSSSCIKSFKPQIKVNDTNKYVVNGMINNKKAVQTVNISLSSPIDDPHYIPVIGCNVNVYSKNNKTFHFIDQGDGNYKGSIPFSEMKNGSAFKIKIHTPKGDILESDYDVMTNNPAVDSVFYKRKDIEGNVTGQLTKGIRFYLNFKGNNTDSDFYMWNLYETWEYHVLHPIEWYYDGRIHHVYPPDYSKFTCWHTLKIPQIYTLSTQNLTSNSYSDFPLNFVSNKTQRLAYGYSLLVEQLSLSETAYNYWDRIRLNNSKNGGLYEKQPLTIKGNIHNVKHPEKEVLGLFGTAMATYKRIFVSNVPDLPMEYQTYCGTWELRRGFSELQPDDLPAYLVGDRYGYKAIVYSRECVDCTALGGKTTKPSFWPN